MPARDRQTLGDGGLHALRAPPGEPLRARSRLPQSAASSPAIRVACRVPVPSGRRSPRRAFASLADRPSLSAGRRARPGSSRSRGRTPYGWPPPSPRHALRQTARWRRRRSGSPPPRYSPAAARASPAPGRRRPPAHLRLGRRLPRGVYVHAGPVAEHPAAPDVQPPPGSGALYSTAHRAVFRPTATDSPGIRASRSRRFPCRRLASRPRSWLSRWALKRSSPRIPVGKSSEISENWPTLSPCRYLVSRLW